MNLEWRIKFFESGRLSSVHGVKEGVMRLVWRVTALLVMMAFLVSAPAGAQMMTPRPSPVVAGAESSLIKVNLLGLRPDRVEPLRFDFILGLPSSADPLVSIPEEANRLTDYFLAALTIPQADLWVNLSPYEKDRIIPAAFGRTAMGRDLLEQDYQLKQFTAQLLSPQNETGRRFWDRMRQLGDEAGLESRDALDVFHKVWIVPDEATVYETASGVLIREARLRVMMENDYLANRQIWAAEAKASPNVNPDGENGLSASAVTLMKEILLPVIEQEVNQGGRFEKLRQIYHAIILAAWYKEVFAGSVVNQQYSDQRKLTGIASQTLTSPKEIYTEYLQLFENGAGSMVEDYDPNVGDIVVRKYFSGGVNLTQPERLSSDFAMSSEDNDPRIVGLRVDLSVDSAMGDLSQSPERAFKVNDQKLREWVSAEIDVRVKQIKEKIAQQITYVDYARFRERLSQVIDQLNQNVFDKPDWQDVPYAVLWDTAPHKSRRWVYEQIKDELKVFPEAADYFDISNDNLRKRFHTIVETGIQHFVIIDDAAYTGDQIRETIIGVRSWFRQNQADVHPKFVVVAPYFSRQAALNFELFSQDEDIQTVFVEIMPSLRERLSSREINLLDERNGLLDPQGSYWNTGLFPNVFAHTVGDDFSVPNPLTEFVILGRTVYRDPQTSYYQREEKDFHDKAMITFLESQPAESIVSVKRWIEDARDKLTQVRTFQERQILQELRDELEVFERALRANELELLDIPGFESADLQSLFRESTSWQIGLWMSTVQSLDEFEMSLIRWMESDRMASDALRIILSQLLESLSSSRGDMIMPRLVDLLAWSGQKPVFLVGAPATLMAVRGFMDFHQMTDADVIYNPSLTELSLAMEITGLEEQRFYKTSFSRSNLESLPGKRQDYFAIAFDDIQDVDLRSTETYDVRVSLSGFKQLYQHRSAEEVKTAVRNAFGLLEGGRPLIVGGSLSDAEVLQLGQTWGQLKTSGGIENLLLVISTGFNESLESISRFDFLRDQNVYFRNSREEPWPEHEEGRDIDVVILNSQGELATIYTLLEGGTYPGVAVVGEDRNLAEAVGWGPVRTFSGPWRNNHGLFLEMSNGQAVDFFDPGNLGGILINEAQRIEEAQNGLRTKKNFLDGLRRSPNITRVGGILAVEILRRTLISSENANEVTAQARESEPLGGIDFNRSALRLNVHKEPGMEASARPSFSADFKIDGLTSGRMEMVPIEDIQLFLRSTH